MRAMRGFTFRWLWRLTVLAFLMAWAGSGFWHSAKRLPPGLHIAGSWENLAANDIHFLHDLSAADATGAPLSERQIDAKLLQMIARAKEIVVLDAGLFGDLPAAGPRAPRLRSAPPVAAAITDALLKARHDQPGLQVLLIVDPASVDLDTAPGPIERLREGGIDVVPVDIDRLRAPNATFVAFWQLCCGWWSHSKGAGSWPNPIGVGPPGVAFGLWGRTPGYQRSHRQLMIADDGAGNLDGMIFSRPLNAEAALHSATALHVSGSALASALESEFAVAQFSGWTGGGAMQARSQHLAERQRQSALSRRDPARVRVVSEAMLGDTLVSMIDAAAKHSSIDIAALYLSQRDLVRALLDAARRGVAVRILLDPNKDGYGYERSGIPNRVVASELVADSDGAARVRWYRTHGEQFSAGFVLIRGTQHTWLTVGTAELCRRDLDDFNLSAAFIAEVPVDSSAAVDALTWFDTLWFNRAPGGIEYTSDADVYADASQLHYWQYRLSEVSGAAFE
jgi:PLD-like domain